MSSMGTLGKKEAKLMDDGHLSAWRGMEVEAYRIESVRGGTELLGTPPVAVPAPLIHLCVLVPCMDMAALRMVAE